MSNKFIFNKLCDNAIMVRYIMSLEHVQWKLTGTSIKIPRMLYTLFAVISGRSCTREFVNARKIRFI